MMQDPPPAQQTTWDWRTIIRITCWGTLGTFVFGLVACVMAFVLAERARQAIDIVFVLQAIVLLIISIVVGASISFLIGVAGQLQKKLPW